jgi:phage repressor protein C with HTH and peptisase S24 domain
MLSHKGVWQAIDRLAEKYGFSASGLAKRAGLDPTTFNKSKRVSREGKPRWPSTESVAKVLEATGASIGEFMGLIGDETGSAGPYRIPVIGLTKAGSAGYFDDAGFPTGHGWDEIPFPEIGDPNAYALEISGESMAPVFRDGDLVVVSPAAQVRRGDRVVVKTTEGEVMAKQLHRKTARKVELESLNPTFPARELDIDQIAWMHRIVWASQ